jgi:arylsulfatase
MSHCVVPTGECTIRYAFERVGESGGVGRLFLGDREVGDVHVPRTIDASFASVGLLIGANAGTSVSPAYDSPFPFRGTIRKVVYELAR